MPSTFKLSPEFRPAMDRIRNGIELAGELGMRAVMDLAESDARKNHRWRQRGQHTATSAGGSQWTWEVTGTTEESISGYVVSDKSRKRLNPVNERSSKVYLKLADGKEVTFSKRHTTNAGLTGDYTPSQGQILGVLTMYTAYAGYLQAKEQQGTTLPGGMGPGETITVEVFDQNWGPLYSRLMKAVMERTMAAATAGLG